MEKDVYENPLTKRYASKAMSYVWSPHKKFTTWKKLWIALAKAEKELGLNISDEQIAEMEANVEEIDYEFAEQKEKELRHDVMAHIHAFGKQCPRAAPIIHLGATSCYIGDNTELIQMKESMQIIETKLVVLMDRLAQFARKYKSLPTLGYTHFQPAQLVTVGKRACLWLQDFLFDYERLVREKQELPMRGVKGTTGSQASFLELFGGDHEKVVRLNELVVRYMGFDRAISVSGQTYSRKIDFFVLAVLSGIAQSAHKMATDIRLLANLKEIEEPFAKNQVGSSAMAYKRNPMRSERICSLARFVMNLLDNTQQTHSTQWMERTLDDSANRRLVLAESFLGVDAILAIAIDIVTGLQVWPRVIAARVNQELPFMATENILMACTKAGGDRQQLHEAIREHSMAAGMRVKNEGHDNDLLDRIRNDPRFGAIHEKLDTIMDPQNFIGRCPEQVDEFLAADIDPILQKHKSHLDSHIDQGLHV